MKPSPDEDQFVCIGDYSPPEAERLPNALTSAHIKFAIDCYDGVESVAAKGSFGTEADIRVCVEPKKAGEAKKLQTDLFGDISP